MAVLEQTLHIPTQEEIAAIENPDQLPDFLNHGLIAALAHLIKANHRQIQGLDYEAVLVGDEAYVQTPAENSGLLAVVREPATEEGRPTMVISSNIKPGIFMHLPLDRDYSFYPNGATHATHLGVEKGYYSKSGANRTFGYPSTVGHVLRSAMPTIIEHTEGPLSA